MKNIFIVGACLFSIAFSVAAFCKSYSLGNDFDYVTMLIAIISLLVCALMAWNFYEMYDLRQHKQEVKNIIGIVDQKNDFHLHQSKAVIAHDIWMLYHYLIYNEDPESLGYRYLTSAIDYISHSSSCGEFVTCSNVVRILQEQLTTQRLTIARPENRTELLQLLLHVPHSDKIEGFYNLVEMISHLRTNRDETINQATS